MHQTTVSEFGRQVVLGTAEGRIAALGSLLCLGWGLALLVTPGLLPEPTSHAQGVALGFVFMPVVLLVSLVRFAYPTASPSWLTCLVMVGVTALPFYVAYNA